MEHETSEPEPQPPQLPSPWALPEGATRHDGWTGERMAKFCEVLSETGLVADACLAVGKSATGAYALRQRQPVFAAAWIAALTIARERLADTLLARALEGTVEQYYKDGELVGERKVIDNRLGLAILRRLDRMAEPATASPGRATVTRTARSPKREMDWDLALSALRTGDENALAKALAMFEGNEVDEVDDPRIHPASTQLWHVEDEEEEEEPHVWRDESGQWWTDFAPPDGFEGKERGQWNTTNYKRHCSAEECAILDAERAAFLKVERDEGESQRDAFFASIQAALADSGGEACEPKGADEPLRSP